MGLMKKLLNLASGSDDENVKMQEGYAGTLYKADIAGTFRRQDALESLVEENPYYFKTTTKLAYRYNSAKYEATLKAEKTNKHDPNAIAVYIGDMKIGYVTAADCQKVREVCRKATYVCVYIRGGGYRKPDEDGIASYREEFKAMLLIR